MACQDSQWMMEQLWEHFEFYKQIFLQMLFYNKFIELAFHTNGDFYKRHYFIRQHLTKMVSMQNEKFS